MKIFSLYTNLGDLVAFVDKYLKHFFERYLNRNSYEFYEDEYIYLVVLLLINHWKESLWQQHSRHF